MFINFTNHPSDKWSEEQISVAEQSYGTIVDLPFPAVPTDADQAWISQEANAQIAKMDSLFTNADSHKNAVLCQGEFTLAFAVITRLLERGIKVVSAVSERNAREIQVDGETRKEVIFRFAGFREYAK